MNQFEAVLFDIDGTLLDTKEITYLAFEHAFDVHGLPKLPRERHYEYLHGTFLDAFADPQGLVDPRAAALTFRLFQESQVHMIKPYTQTEQVLEALQQAGLKLGVVSSRPRESVEILLQQTGLDGYFEARVCGREAPTKPDPAGIQKVLADLSVEPVAAVMVGDDDVDVIAGKAAGTKTIGVTYGFTGSSIIDYEPDHVAAEIADILPFILGQTDYRNAILAKEEVGAR